MSELVTHQGIIKKINTQTVEIEISLQSACANCATKKGCSLSESKQSSWEVPTPIPSIFTLNETVEVFVKQTTAFKAVCIAYVLSFFVLILSLCICIGIFHIEEGISALISLGFLGLYFCMMYWTRGQWENKFTLEVRKRGFHNQYSHKS